MCLSVKLGKMKLSEVRADSREAVRKTVASMSEQQLRDYCESKVEE